MASISDGESGGSVRAKLNAVLEFFSGTDIIDVTSVTGLDSLPLNLNSAGSQALNLNGGADVGDGGGHININPGANAGTGAGNIVINGGSSQGISGGKGGDLTLNAGKSGPLAVAGSIKLFGGDTGVTAAVFSSVIIDGIPADDGSGNQDGGSIHIATGTGAGTGKPGDLTITLRGNCIVLNLPGSDPGVSGALWNDGGTLKISP